MANEHAEWAQGWLRAKAAGCREAARYCPEAPERHIREAEMYENAASEIERLEARVRELVEVVQEIVDGMYCGCTEPPSKADPCWHCRACAALRRIREDGE